MRLPVQQFIMIEHLEYDGIVCNVDAFITLSGAYSGFHQREYNLFCGYRAIISPIHPKTVVLYLICLAHKYANTEIILSMPLLI